MRNARSLSLSFSFLLCVSLSLSLLSVFFFLSFSLLSLFRSLSLDVQRVDDEADGGHVMREQLPEVPPLDVEEEQRGNRLEVVTFHSFFFFSKRVLSSPPPFVVVEKTNSPKHSSFLSKLTELQRVRQAHRPRDLVVARRERGAPFPEVWRVEKKPKRRCRGRRERGQGEVDEELPGGLCFLV